MLRILRRRPSGGDSGFTLIELTVAMFITLLVVTALVGVFLRALTGVTLSKQRQAATALATGVMEQFRAVDYATLSAGMVCSDLTSDPRLTITGTCGAGGTVTFTPSVSGISETVKVQTSTPASAIAPIYPHVVERTVEGQAYEVAAYVTNAATTQESFQLTVLVTWSSAVSSGEKLVIQRSLAYSPSRCLSSATHPYAGACQAAFRGDAGVTNAGIRVINADTPGAPIAGLSGTEIGLALPTLSTTVGTEQISKLSGTVGTTAGSWTDGTSSTGNGGAAATAAADTDPSSIDAAGDTASVNQGSLSAVTGSGSAGDLIVRPGTADSGSVATATSSTATSCVDAGGVALPATGLPCTTGNIASAGDDAALELDLAGSLPALTVASVGPSPTSSRAAVARLTTTSGGVACPTASGLGCVTAQARRALGVVALGGLPTSSAGDTPPPNWAGYLVQVSGVEESAWAESGFGARPAPGFQRSGGTLSYYDAAAGQYVSKDLTALTSDLEIPLSPVTGTWVRDGREITITLAGSVRAGGTSLASPTVTAPDPACKTAACEQAATVASTVVADFAYSIAVDGVVTTRFTVVADLGAVLARTSYKAAFDA